MGGRKEGCLNDAAVHYITCEWVGGWVGGTYPVAMVETNWEAILVLLGVH